MMKLPGVYFSSTLLIFGFADKRDENPRYTSIDKKRTSRVVAVEVENTLRKEETTAHHT